MTNKIEDLIKDRCRKVSNGRSGIKYGGMFNLRVPPEMHEWLHKQADINDVSMNKYIRILFDIHKESIEENKNVD